MASNRYRSDVLVTRLLPKREAGEKRQTSGMENEQN